MTELLTARQVAELLGVSVESVLRYFRSGRLDGFRLGGSGPLRFTAAAVDVFCGGRLEERPASRLEEVRP